MEALDNDPDGYNYLVTHYHYSDIYTGINWCKNTCIIIECGFMSNEKEDKLLNSPEYQEKIAEGITNYFLSGKE